MVTFTKNWELALFWKKVDQLGHKSFTQNEQKFKDCNSTISCLPGKQNASCFNEVPQALGGTTSITMFLFLDSYSL
jgi:hypothetical protein